MQEEIPEELRTQIADFQQKQQQARMVAAQKYQVEVELKETKNALDEISKSKKPEVHKVVGKVLIKAEPSKIKKELEDKKETLELRLKTLKKQEEKLKKGLKEIQETLQGSMPVGG